MVVVRPTTPQGLLGLQRMPGPPAAYAVEVGYGYTGSHVTRLCDACLTDLHDALTARLTDDRPDAPHEVHVRGYNDDRASALSHVEADRGRGWAARYFLRVRQESGYRSRLESKGWKHQATEESPPGSPQADTPCQIILVPSVGP